MDLNPEVYEPVLDYVSSSVSIAEIEELFLKNLDDPLSDPMDMFEEMDLKDELSGKYDINLV